MRAGCLLLTRMLTHWRTGCLLLTHWRTGCLLLTRLRKAVRRHTRKYSTSSMKERVEREGEKHTKEYKRSICMEERSAGSKRVRPRMRRMR